METTIEHDTHDNVLGGIKVIYCAGAGMGACGVFGGEGCVKEIRSGMLCRLERWLWEAARWWMGSPRGWNL